MSSDSFISSSDIQTAYRTRLEMELYEREQQKQHQLIEQRSKLNTPEARIRIWETVHHLRLPLDSQHAILHVVAVATGLTLAEVHGEQEARRARMPPKG